MPDFCVLWIDKYEKCSIESRRDDLRALRILS